MKLRHELSLAWTLLVVVQVLTLFGAVGLLGRMAPAVTEILADNEYTIEAVETMLVELGSSAPEARARFEQALAAANENVTEDDEPEQLEHIARRHAAAFDGDPVAREEVTTALLALSRINRRAMGRAASRASDLGRTGAWAAAVLGLLSLAAAIAVARRLERRVVEPTETLEAALAAIQGGDRYRRCPRRGPDELVALGRGIEALRRPPESSSEEEADPPPDPRRLLLAVLDTFPEAAIVVDAEGSVRHANQAGTHALLEDPALSDRLRAEAEPERWARVSLGDDGTLLRATGPSPMRRP